MQVDTPQQPKTSKQVDTTNLTYYNKQEIMQLLTSRYNETGSIEECAASMPGISERTIADMLKGDRMNIEHCVWIAVGKKLGWKHKHKIKIVETANSRTLLFYFNAAKEQGETFALVGSAGSGKTYVGMHYAKSEAGKNVYLLQCAEYLNKNTFCKELLKVMGRNAGGKSTYDMMEEIVTVLRGHNKPLIILDEVDKLRNDVISFFITLYNRLYGFCGIVWTSTDAIVQKIERGVKSNRIGFNEIYSRIGRRFIELPGLKKKEVEEVCIQQGVDDPEERAQIWNECDKDFRRVDRMIFKHNMKKTEKP